MTHKIKHVTLLKLEHVKHVKIKHVTCDTENQTCNTFKVKHVKHVTQKIKDVTLLKLNM